MKKNFIHLYFEMEQDHTQTITSLQQHFQNVTIICEDCLKALQYMREAYRGAVIATRNIKVHRDIVLTVERARNKRTQPVIELIFTYDNIPVNAQLFGDTMRFNVHADSSEWAENFCNLLLRIFPNTNIEVIISEAKHEILGFYADIERRLNEGDVLRNEIASQDRNIGDFVKQFPQYAHFIK